MPLDIIKFLSVSNLVNSLSNFFLLFFSIKYIVTIIKIKPNKYIDIAIKIAMLLLMFTPTLYILFYHKEVNSKSIK